MAKAFGGDLTPGVTQRGKTPLKEFDYQDVRLLPGMLLTQVEQARALYSSLSNNDILKGFRRQAGRPAPGEGMKGWCQSTSAVIFGQLISGMVRLGWATGDGALIEKADALFEGWLETLPPDGDARMRVYDWDKLVCGLVDLGRYAESKRAVAALRRTVEWASRTFHRTRQPADGHDFWGAGPGDTSEWYTLSENLYRAYLFFGDPLFKEFADTRLLAAFRRNGRPTPGSPGACLQSRQFVFERRGRLPRHRRGALPPDLHQRLRLHADHAVLRDGRLRAR